MTKATHTKFYELTIPGRREMLQKWSDLDDETLDALCGIPGLNSVQADGMIENVVGLYNLPLGIARNFIVNGREVLVPMVIEEPSVVAGASYMAKLVARRNGGFTATSSESIMIGQMQVLDLTDLDKAELAILQNRADLLQEASLTLFIRSASPSAVASGISWSGSSKTCPSAHSWWSISWWTSATRWEQTQ